MTPQAWVYLIGFPIAAIVAAAYLEYERRTSNDRKTKEATLSPGFDGLLVGLFWPLVLGGVLFLGLCWCVTQLGKLLLNLIYN